MESLAGLCLQKLCVRSNQHQLKIKLEALALEKRDKESKFIRLVRKVIDYHRIPTNKVKFSPISLWLVLLPLDSTLFQERLDLGSTNFGTGMPKFKNLKYLNLARTHVDREGLKEISLNIPGISILNFHNCQELTDKDMGLFENFTTLIAVDLEHTNINITGVRTLVEVCPKIQRLNLPCNVRDFFDNKYPSLFYCNTETSSLVIDEKKVETMSLTKLMEQLKMHGQKSNPDRDSVLDVVKKALRKRRLDKEISGKRKDDSRWFDKFFQMNQSSSAPKENKYGFKKKEKPSNPNSPMSIASSTENGGSCDENSRNSQPNNENSNMSFYLPLSAPSPANTISTPVISNATTSAKDTPKDSLEESPANKVGKQKVIEKAPTSFPGIFRENKSENHLVFSTNNNNNNKKKDEITVSGSKKISLTIDVEEIQKNRDVDMEIAEKEIVKEKKREKEKGIGTIVLKGKTIERKNLERVQEKPKENKSSYKENEKAVSPPRGRKKKRESQDNTASATNDQTPIETAKKKKPESENSYENQQIQVLKIVDAIKKIDKSKVVWGPDGKVKGDSCFGLLSKQARDPKLLDYGQNLDNFEALLNANVARIEATYPTQCKQKRAIGDIKFALPHLLLDARLQLGYIDKESIACIFCQRKDDDIAGPLNRIKDREYNLWVWCHENCVMWAPKVFCDLNAKVDEDEEDDEVDNDEMQLDEEDDEEADLDNVKKLKNIMKEWRRSKGLKCTECGHAHAPTGCGNDCGRQYHYACAVLSGCQMGNDFVLLCAWCYRAKNNIQQFNNADSWSDYCGLCRKEGVLVCCDGGCQRAFHVACLGLEDVPDLDKWSCSECVRGDNAIANQRANKVKKAKGKKKRK